MPAAADASGKAATALKEAVPIDKAGASLAKSEAEPTTEFEEILRPSKGRDEERPQRGKGRGKGMGRRQAKPGPDGKPRQSKGHKKPRKQDRSQKGKTGHHAPSERRLSEHSPFAALKELRDSLADRAKQS